MWLDLKHEQEKKSEKRKVHGELNRCQLLSRRGLAWATLHVGAKPGGRSLGTENKNNWDEG